MIRSPSRIRAAGLVVLAGVGVVAFTACGAKSNEPAPTTSSSPSLQPTSKATFPGPNNFSPAPIAPLNPTVNPTNAQTTHP
ncbi:hypothetical protein [Mycolicibacterium sphagni]|uniref:hypothetical protein n=1 Tax=Mycolicibacterium sphagni TaxID=1786 RepID=UPI0021F2CC91|nr:hypothetical protein [Mycolicibacterium sphagni]MCV7178029.1 hypothetical protein [Mycolicibacterium sphagni]